MKTILEQSEALFAFAGLLFWGASMISTLLITRARLQDLEERVKGSIVHMQYTLEHEVLTMLREIQVDRVVQGKQIAAIEARCVERSRARTEGTW